MSETIDMSKITDEELVEEFKKRFLVLQFHEKESLEFLVNDQEEISQERYEKFKEYCDRNHYYNDVDNVIEQVWDNFNDEEEEEK